jgi:hypothetical protein
MTIIFAPDLYFGAGIRGSRNREKSMRALQILCFIFALLPLSVLAHDAYRWYEAQENGQNLPFSLSDLGYLWMTYHEESHDMALEELGAEQWNENIKPVLRMPAAFVTAVPAVVFGLLFGILWLFGSWPFNRLHMRKGGGSDFAATQHRKKGLSYKRK